MYLKSPRTLDVQGPRGSILAHRDLGQFDDDLVMLVEAVEGIHAHLVIALSELEHLVERDGGDVRSADVEQRPADSIHDLVENRAEDCVDHEVAIFERWGATVVTVVVTHEPEGIRPLLALGPHSSNAVGHQQAGANLFPLPWVDVAGLCQVGIIRYRLEPTEAKVPVERVGPVLEFTILIQYRGERNALYRTDLLDRAELYPAPHTLHGPICHAAVPEEQRGGPWGIEVVVLEVVEGREQAVHSFACLFVGR